MTTSILTQEQLKSILHYDQKTGIFTWRIRSSNRVKIGMAAGTKHIMGYVSISIDKKPYLSHRLAWLYVHGYMPTNEIDHINGVRNDNRILNLREANHAENIRNTGMYSHNTSGYRGVYFRKDTNKWQSQTKLHGKHISLGSFDTAIEASKAYESYVLINHGVFHRITVEQPL